MLAIADRARRRSWVAALQAAYRVTRRAAGTHLAGDVSLAVVDRRTMQRFNRAYRQRDEPTDVLSFPGVGPADRPSGGAGEVVICLPIARRQARERGHSLCTELQLLLVHGLLHLAGFDHHRSAAARRMAALERRIMGSLGGGEGLMGRAGSGRR